MVELHKHSISKRYEEKKGTNIYKKHLEHPHSHISLEKEGSGICYVLD